MFAVQGFWKEKFLFIGLPYMQGSHLPSDFNFSNMKEFAEAKGLKQVYTADLFDKNTEYQWDLNKPIPQKYHESFNTVFDIGTIEHIFDTKQCLENYLKLVSVGGIFAVVTPVNGYFEHGFHVFNPQTIIQTLKQNNFSIEYRSFSTSTGFEVNDPSIRKDILLFLVARKKKSIKNFTIPQQEYWKEMYTKSSTHYQDLTIKNSNLASLFDGLKKVKRRIILSLPIELRTKLLRMTK